MLLGVGFDGGHTGGGGSPSDGTGLVVVARLLQLLGFAIPVVVSTTTEAGPA